LILVLKTIRGSVKKIEVTEEEEPERANINSYKESSLGVNKFIQSSKKILLPRLSQSDTLRQIINQQDNEEEEEEYSDSEAVVIRKKIKLEFGNLSGKIQKEFEENKYPNFVCNFNKKENSINETSKIDPTLA